MTDVQRRLKKARADALKKWKDPSYVNLGEHHYRLNVVRSPSLMLDYKLGIGGFPYGHGIEIYGANRIGKSSAIAYGTLGNVQKEGKLPCLIAVEPRMVTPEDREWGKRLGFDPDQAFIQYPDNVEEAFDMLRDAVFGNLVDYIAIDSLGGLGNASSAQEGGTPKAFGISGAVTAGLNDIMPRLYKNNIGLMILNQQRQKTIPGARPGQVAYESPGGEALHHHMRIRIQLKPGSDRYSTKIDGEDVLVGRELVAAIKKNNMAEGQEKKANFTFYHIATDQYGFGIDIAQDVINVGMIAGVMRREESNYFHEIFPKGKLYGKPKVRDFLLNNPEAYEQIRQEVMAVMVKNELEEAAKRREAEAKAKVEQSTEESTDE